MSHHLVEEPVGELGEALGVPRDAPEGFAVVLMDWGEGDVVGGW